MNNTDNTVSVWYDTNSPNFDPYVRSSLTYPPFESTISITDNTGFSTFPDNSYFYSNTNQNGNLTFTKSNNNKLTINGDDADLEINGKSLKTFMEKVEERLCILQPDPAKLEKYEALRKAYEQYKLLEKLIGNE